MLVECDLADLERCRTCFAVPSSLRRTTSRAQRTVLQSVPRSAAWQSSTRGATPPGSMIRAGRAYFAQQGAFWTLLMFPIDTLGGAAPTYAEKTKERFQVAAECNNLLEKGTKKPKRLGPTRMSNEATTTEE